MIRQPAPGRPEEAQMPDVEGLLSVRGYAEQTVAPDLVRLSASVHVAETGKAVSLRAATQAWQQVTQALTALGGVPLDVGSAQRPLTWSAHSVTTHAEGDHDPATKRWEPSGVVIATVGSEIVVRDFALLDPLAGALAPLTAVSLHSAMWEVDEDNAAWPVVRAAAIAAALRKGRDYAGALGGSLERLEHLADAGLLGGAADRPERFARPAGAFNLGHESGGDSPSLDPVPQQVSATVEARFVATGLSLQGGLG